MIPSWASDNPALITGVVRALLGLVVAFWPNAFNQTQQETIIGLVVAMLALTAVTVKSTVPKSPSSMEATASIQVPPPGATLVTTAAADAPIAIPASDRIAAGPSIP